MQIVNKTHLKTYSEPDQHRYQEQLLDEETHPIRESQSVTVYNRHKQPIPKLPKRNLTQLTFTGTVTQSVLTIFKFTQKTISQIKKKEKIEYRQNLLSSVKEANHIGLYLLEKIKTIQPSPIKIVPPTQMVSKCWQKFISKKKQNQSQNQQQSGLRDEDDIHNQIII